MPARPKHKKRISKLKCPFCPGSFDGIAGLNAHLQANAACRERQRLQGIAAAQQMHPPAAPATPAAPAAQPPQPRRVFHSDSDEDDGPGARAPSAPEAELPDHTSSSAPSHTRRSGSGRRVPDPLSGSHTQLDGPLHSIAPASKPKSRDQLPDMSYLLTSQAALEITELLLTLKTKQRPKLLKYLDAEVKQQLPFTNLKEFNEWLIPANEKVRHVPYLCPDPVKVSYVLLCFRNARPDQVCPIRLTRSQASFYILLPTGPLEQAHILVCILGHCAHMNAAQAGLEERGCAQRIWSGLPCLVPERRRDCLRTLRSGA